MTTQARFVDHRIATPDPPPRGVPNPIHQSDGAGGAGYAGALVAGVRTYGWACETIVRAAGRRWLSDGWVDYSLRRPLFADEELTITVEPDGDDELGAFRFAVVADGAGGKRVVLDGTGGLGSAPWLDQLRPPAPASGREPPATRPGYDLATVPLNQPLRPLTVGVGPDAARRMVTEDLGIEDRGVDDRGESEAPDPVDRRSVIHPFFLAARMAPLTRHNFTYGPTIHVRSQIQHLAVPRSGQDITVGAVIVDAFERNRHWYQILDGVITGSDPGRELARIRHHTIFRPRET